MLSSLVLATSSAPPPKPSVTPKTGSGGVSSALDSPSRRKEFSDGLLPLLRKYCIDCHQGRSASAGVDITRYRTLSDLLKHRQTWERIASNVESSAMPPAGSPQPTGAERTRIASFVQGLFSQLDCSIDDPGRVTMRRLNRVEYRNTIRDLLGVETKVTDDFPSDDVGYGFDNIGDILTISPLLMEKYLDAARKVARQVVVAPEDRGLAPVIRFGASLIGAGGGPRESAFVLGTQGVAAFEHVFPVAGEYEIVVEAWGDQGGDQPCRMGIVVGDRTIGKFDVPQEEGKSGRFSTRVKVDVPGKRRIGAEFLNDFWNPNEPNPRRRDRNLAIESISVIPPRGARLAGDVSEGQRRLLAAYPSLRTPAAWDQAMGKVLAPLASRAFRRPLRAGELPGLVAITRLALKRDQSFERGVQLGLQAVLVSPHFLFRVELDPKPGDPKARRELSDHELATRLSYFLWSTMPDDTLLALASKGRLRDPVVLRQQVLRMLKDRRSTALAENFAGQWLQLRKLSVVQPDNQRFPSFDETLRDAMRLETQMFFTDIVQSDRSVLEFLSTSRTFLNERLARHYGLAGVSGPEMRPFVLPEGPRAGLLGHASILTLTSNPGRTSPVKRGKWVLENLLGTPPPPPPPNVPELPENKRGTAELKTVRARLEEHRRNPACNACHQRLDGIGLAMENFDGVGSWRDQDEGHAIDASGDLPGGIRFQGPVQLRDVLLKQKGKFVRTLAERLLTYGIGRGLESYDQCNLDAMASRVASKGYRFSEVVLAVVESKPFRSRRGDESGGGLKPGKVSRGLSGRGAGKIASAQGGGEYGHDKLPLARPESPSPNPRPSPSPTCSCAP